MYFQIRIIIIFQIHGFDSKALLSDGRTKFECKLIHRLLILSKGFKTNNHIRPNYRYLLLNTVSFTKTKV